MWAGRRAIEVGHALDEARVEIEPGSSVLEETGYAKCQDLRAVSPLRPERRFGRAEDTVMFRVDVILRRLLSW